MADWYSQAPQNVERYNYYGWDAFAYDQGAEALNMTAMIFSHVSERRSSAYRMAAAAGFTDIELVGTLPYTEVDLEDLKARGEVSHDFCKNYNHVQQQKFAAHALDFRDLAKRAGVQGHAWVAFLEDDIVLTFPPSVASKRIRDAIEQVPPFCDCIYLEYCNEFCDESRFHSQKQVVSTAAQPYCSAAILYSASGLLKLQQHLVPLVDPIDNMLAMLCITMKINCFKLRLPVFAQDRLWGSQFTPESKAREAFHALVYQPGLCREMKVDPSPLRSWSPDHFFYYKEAVNHVRRYNLLGKNAHASDAGPEELQAHVCIRNRTHTHTHTHTHTRTDTNARAHTYIHARTHAYIHAYTHMRAYIHTHTYTNACTRAQMQVHQCTHARVLVCACARAHTHTQEHSLTLTHTDLHTL
jgi:hypothetical protein